MTFINVGAYVGGSRPKSKKALKEALAAGPKVIAVEFERTSELGPALPRNVYELPPGTKLQVTGPDPYTSRKWYATVELVNGKVKVS